MSQTAELPWLSVACREGGDHHCRSSVCECRRCHAWEIGHRKLSRAKSAQDAYDAMIEAGLDETGAVRVANAWTLANTARRTINAKLADHGSPFRAEIHVVRGAAHAWRPLDVHVRYTFVPASLHG